MLTKKLSSVKLKIAVIAPIWIRVPPVAYGGIELVVSLLVEGLVARGHDVTLFASGDSCTESKLVSVYPLPQTDKMGSLFPNMFHVGAAYDHCRQDDFDIIHDHTNYAGAVFGGHIAKPILVTLHTELNSSNTSFFRRFKDTAYYNAVSEHQRQLVPDLKYVKTVYNTIDFNSYSVQNEKKGYLLALSRICPEKGTHLAVEVAKKSGRRLIIAGRIDKRYQEYFRNMVEPHVDGDQIKFRDEIDEHQKRDLLSGADCLIFPIQWDEPFGLVILESMASGTPVVAFNHGAVSELIMPGRNGFIVESINEMVGKLDECASIDSFQCRRWAESRFSTDKMVEGYLANYLHILRNEGRIDRSTAVA